MTNETIEKHIDEMNEGKYQGKDLGKNVVRTEIPREWEFYPYEFFFIRNESGVYVAALLEMGVHDFHVFTKGEHRRKGYIFRAMNDKILPYLKKDGIRVQGVTYCDESKGLILKLGFRIIDESRAELDLTTWKPAKKKKRPKYE
jgi:hypothetical protein